MNDPEKNESPIPQGASIPNPGAPGSGDPENPRPEVDSKKKAKAAKPKARDIYTVVEKAQVVDPALIDRIFETLGKLEDPAPLLATLLREWMDATAPKVWGKLRDHNVPARLFERLCATVGNPELSYAWNHMGREGVPLLLGTLAEYVPPSREAALRFLHDRSMLPLSILIYRAFRNDEVAMGKVIREWLGLIASGCDDQRENIQKESQRTARWLIELSAKKLSPAEFLNAVAPSLTPLRLAKRTFEDNESLASAIGEKDGELDRKIDEVAALEARVAELTEELQTQQQEVANANAKIESLEDAIQFGQTRRTESEAQATGALKERLRISVLQRIEDARLFLDRPEPNTKAVLDLLTEIETQFD